MSDTRAAAAEDLEDALGSTLSSSFSPPSAPVRHRPAEEVGTTQSSSAVPAEPEAASAPVPGMDEWKSTYDAYVEHWQSESKDARAVAEKNRLFYEAQQAEEERKVKEEAVRVKRAQEKMKREQEEAERLRRELAGEGSGSGMGSASARKAKAVREREREERERKVKEAWEMVKGGGEEGQQGQQGKTSEVVHAGDARGVMPQDVQAGQVVGADQHRQHRAQTAYDPITSTEPLPPSMQDDNNNSAVSSPLRPSGPSGITSSQTLSRHSATSQAWEEISGTPSSAEDLSPPGSGSGLSSDENVPRSSSNAAPAPGSKGNSTEKGVSVPSGTNLSANSQNQNQNQNQNQPPAQPPSLTLSLFTSPSSLSVSRVVAVLGINLVLPFINGVMLGFGEIFAREVFRVGRLVIRGERSLFGWGRRGEEARGGARGVGSVGLSGSGGFP